MISLPIILMSEDWPLESIQFHRNFSRNVLIRMGVLAFAAAGLLLWKLDFINNVYFRDQLTVTGIVINGAILGLFLLGLFRIVVLLLGYRREEAALQQVISNLGEGSEPMDNVAGERARKLHHLLRHPHMQTIRVSQHDSRASVPFVGVRRRASGRLRNGGHHSRFLSPASSVASVRTSPRETCLKGTSLPARSDQW